MTQFVDLTVTDSASVARIFKVSTIDYSSGVATWLGSGASYDAQPPITFNIKTPSARSNRTRVRARIVIPIMDPVLTTKKVDEVIGEVTFNIPKTATLLQRQDLRVLLRNLLLDNIMINAVETSQGVY